MVHNGVMREQWCLAFVVSFLEPMNPALQRPAKTEFQLCAQFRIRDFTGAPEDWKEKFFRLVVERGNRNNLEKIRRSCQHLRELCAFAVLRSGVATNWFLIADNIEVLETWIEVV